MKIIPTIGNIDPKIEVGEFAFGLEIKVSDTAMDKLWEYISSAKENPKSKKSTLVGNLFSSLELNDTDNYFFNNTCLPIIDEYKKTFGKGRTLPNRIDPDPLKENRSTASGYHQQSIFKNNVPYAISDLWVNFMKQHEFQPLHNHSGIYSFNVFMKIPYDWREQYEIPFIKESKERKAGNFEFIFSDIMGNFTAYKYQLDSSYEGTMLFFPSEMHHLVYPFYNCEEERITISGNIGYDI